MVLEMNPSDKSYFLLNNRKLLLLLKRATLPAGHAIPCKFEKNLGFRN